MLAAAVAASLLHGVSMCKLSAFLMLQLWRKLCGILASQMKFA